MFMRDTYYIVETADGPTPFEIRRRNEERHIDENFRYARTRDEAETIVARAHVADEQMEQENQAFIDSLTDAGVPRKPLPADELERQYRDQQELAEIDADILTAGMSGKGDLTQALKDERRSLVHDREEERQFDVPERGRKARYMSPFRRKDQ